MNNQHPWNDNYRSDNFGTGKPLLKWKFISVIYVVNFILLDGQFKQMQIRKNKLFPLCR